MPKYKITDETFVNPYHFVPLDKKCEKNINYKELINKSENLNTGWIECTLETLTPLFIPNTTNDDFFKVQKKNKIKIKSYDFFSYENLADNQKQQPTNNPVIPGSSIRGTIRSAFEALTNSCMSTTDDNHVLYKRTTSAGQPGRLVRQNNYWEIIPCKKYMLKVKKCLKDPSKEHNIKEYKDKDTIYFICGGNYAGIPFMPKVVQEIRKSLDNNNSNNSYIKGYLHIGEPFTRKHHESIFVDNKQEESIKITEKDVISLLENYRLYQDDTVNLAKKKREDEKGEHNGYKSNISDAKNAKIDNLDGALVYYKERNGKIYLSPAAIGREVFHNRLKDIIDTYHPCSDIRKLCPACALFGFAGNQTEDKKNTSGSDALASRVRFTDAKPVGRPRMLKPVILPELASPKESATEFYLKRPKKNADMWNYDYAGNWNKNDFITIGTYKPEIQGRKFYLHHKEMKSFDDENQKRFQHQKIEYSDRLVQVRPVDKGNKFTFRIYFNKVTEEELKRLIWTVSLGNKKNLAHKLGMGKPVGLGSIKINVEKVKIRHIQIGDNSLSYTIEDYQYSPENINMGCSEESMYAFETIAEYTNPPANICYPYCTDAQGHHIPENYEWFVGNKRIKDKASGIRHIIDQDLKPIVLGSKIPKLNVIKKIEKFK